MRWIVALMFACVVAGPIRAADTDDARRAQTAAANADALATLQNDVLSEPITKDLSVRQLVERTHSQNAFAEALRRAEQIGGTRWPDDHTCQVRLELPGSDVADALVKIAEANPREAGLPVDALRQRVERFRDVTFAATGMSTCAADRLRPPPGRAAWVGVSDDAMRTAVTEARRNAARRLLDDIRAIPGAGQSDLGKVLNDRKVNDDLESWMMNRPVTSVNFLDDHEVRVAVAVEGESFWDRLAGAVKDRKDLPFPQDDAGRAALRRQVLERIEPSVGKAVARSSAGGASERDVISIPRDPPRWVNDQLDVNGSSRPQDGRLKTARAAESSARDRLRARVNELLLSRNLTVGEATRRDKRVRAAVDRAVQGARPQKVNYLSDGSAEVSFTLDLHDLWDAIDAR